MISFATESKWFTAVPPRGDLLMDTWLLAAADGSELATFELGKRLLFALVLGAAIGLERAFRDKPAGWRIDHLSGTRSYRLTAPNTRGQVARLEKRFKHAGLRIVFTRCAQEGDDVVLRVRARGSADRHNRLRDELLTLDDCHVSKG